MSTVGSISDLPVFGAQNQQAAAAPDNKEDFLKLLVAQMKFQDPMNPLQGSEFAAQLAQFSSVEQLQNINSKMDAQTQSNQLLAQSVNNTLATTLIGKQVRALDDRVVSDGEHSTTINYNLSGMAAPVTFEIQTDTGAVIRTLTQPNAASGDGSITWDGLDDRGNRVPAGTYHVNITADSPTGANVIAMPLTMGRIDGVRFENGNPVLMVNGQQVPFGSVLEILDSQTTNRRSLRSILAGGGF
jgi:flagellar basal-body rod modification protein FlgD